jgi:hypothetical protein
MEDGKIILCVIVILIIKLGNRAGDFYEMHAYPP